MMDKVSELAAALLGWLIDNPPWAVGLTAVITLALWYFLHYKPEQTRAWKQECREVERLTQKQLKEESYQKLLDQRKAAEQKRLEDAQRVTALYEQREREAFDQREQQKAIEAQKAKEQQAAQEKAGRDFELRIVELLKHELSDWFQTYRTRILYNVTIPTYAYQTQIDAILIDTSGIYVIECKCWNRVIIGKYDWPYWLTIQAVLKDGIPVVAKNEQTFYCQAFESPLEQNERHKGAVSVFLQDKIGKKFKQFKRITVFDTCGKTDFILPNDGRGDPWQTPYTWAGNKNELVTTIKEYDQEISKISRLSIGEVTLIYDTLKPYAESFTSTPTAAEMSAALC